MEIFCSDELLLCCANAEGMEDDWRRWEKVLKTRTFPENGLQEGIILSDWVVYSCVTAICARLHSGLNCGMFHQCKRDGGWFGGDGEKFRTRTFPVKWVVRGVLWVIFSCVAASCTRLHSGLNSVMFWRRLRFHSKMDELCDHRCIPDHPHHWLTTHQSAEVPPGEARTARRCYHPGSTWRHADGARSTNAQNPQHLGMRKS